MHNRDKYPEIWAAKERAEAELAPLMDVRGGHMDKVNAVGGEIAKLKTKQEDAHEQACADLPKITELRKEISRFAKAMGAIALGVPAKTDV